jgi:hypothetical protein
VCCAAAAVCAKDYFRAAAFGCAASAAFGCAASAAINWRLE